MKQLCSMKFSFVAGLLSRFTGDSRKSEKFRLLQQQRHLLHEGLEATAEVIDASLFDEKVGSMFPVRLWLKLKKKDGCFIYTHANTLLPFNSLPGKGQMLRIKYFPENLSVVLIL